MTKHNQGVFELTERIFSQITFPNHLMVGSPKEHSDDVVKHSDDAVMQEEQEQACSSNKHSDDAVTQEQEQACLSKEHSDTQEQARRKNILMMQSYKNRPFNFLERSNITCD